MVDPVIVGGVVAGVGVLTAAGYAYLTGDDASAGVDVDNDGEDEVSYTFEGNNEEAKIGEERADGVPESVEYEGDTKVPSEVADDGTVHPSDPTPEVVSEKSGLIDIKGIGPTRAETLTDEGFETPEDIYYASDENLEGVNGIGPKAVSQIRDDIGSIGDE